MDSLDRNWLMKSRDKLSNAYNNNSVCFPEFACALVEGWFAGPLIVIQVFIASFGTHDKETTSGKRVGS